MILQQNSRTAEQQNSRTAEQQNCRNLYLDFVKGIAILSVIFLHNTPANQLGQVVWIGQAVPLFIFVSAFLGYNKFTNTHNFRNYYSLKKIYSLFTRIFLPLIIMTIVQFALFKMLNMNISIPGVILSGGIGPGSYYPWVFLQIWIVLPVIVIAVDKLSLPKSFILFSTLCIILEIANSYLQVPGWLYRLSFYRYLYLLYIGCVIAKYPLTKFTLPFLILASISLIFIILRTYSAFNLEPLFFNSGWGSHSWLAYFYTPFVFLVLSKIYNKIRDKKETTMSFIEKLGSYSYEIFLAQMFVFCFIPKKDCRIMLTLFPNIENTFIQLILFILITTFFSIAPILFYKRYLKNYFLIRNLFIDNKPS